MMQKYPQYLPTTIEKGAYNGIDQPIETVGTGAMFACRADLPDDLVYEIVKTVYSQEGVDYLGNVIAALKSMSPNLAVSYKPIPLHPGAEKYYREAGIPVAIMESLMRTMRSLPIMEKVARTTAP